MPPRVGDPLAAIGGGLAEGPVTEARTPLAGQTIATGGVVVLVVVVGLLLAAVVVLAVAVVVAVVGLDAVALGGERGTAADRTSPVAGPPRRASAAAVPENESRAPPPPPAPPPRRARDPAHDLAAAAATKAHIYCSLMPTSLSSLPKLT